MIELATSALDFKSPEQLEKLQRKAEHLFKSFARLGYEPQYAQAIPSGPIIICFDIMRTGDPRTGWTKSFLADGDVCDENAFLIQMRAWKDKVLKDIAIEMPSAPVRDAIRQHGLMAVMEALKR